MDGTPAHTEGPPRTQPFTLKFTAEEGTAFARFLNKTVQPFKRAPVTYPAFFHYGRSNVANIEEARRLDIAYPLSERIRKKLEKENPQDGQEVSLDIDTPEEQSDLRSALFPKIARSTALQIDGRLEPDEEKPLEFSRKVLGELYEHLGEKPQSIRELLVIGLVDKVSADDLLEVTKDPKQKEFHHSAKFFLNEKLKTQPT